MEMNEYLEVFIEESKEHIQSLNYHLLELEKDSSNDDTISEIFRSAHTLKGMSATMGFQDLANLTHQMENVLDAVRNHQLLIDSEIVDIVFQAVDQLEAMVLDIASGGDGKQNVESLVKKLHAIEKGDIIANTTTNVSSHSINNNQFHSLDEFELTLIKESEQQQLNILEITVKLNENCLLKSARVYMVFDVLEQLGEVIKSSPSVQDLENENFGLEFAVLLVTQQEPTTVKQKIKKVSEIDEVTASAFSVERLKHEEQSNQEDTVAATKEKPVTPGKHINKKDLHKKTIRVNIDRLDALMNLFEELVIDRSRLEQISADLNHNELQDTVERMNRISSDLQSLILNMRMVPIDQVFNRFPRMVRNLARDLGKRVELKVKGAETELDRSVIDEVGDPLVHLIRNALDHGIEQPMIRKEIGKPEAGLLELHAYHSGNHVFIEISDDGAGVDKEKIIDKAISNGVITAEQATTLTDREVYQLMMESGFSTAETVSDISGRGVGLDVVKNAIESLGGNITIDSEYGNGTSFSIQLPLTLSIISVLLVEVQKEKYAIPLSSIIETAIVKRSNVLYAHNKKVIDFRGKVVPLISLKDVFESPAYDEDDYEYYSVVIIRKGDKLAGLIVDSFIGQQEVVLKSLGDYMTNVFAISGATILGDGQVVLIVDTSSLIK